LHGPGAPPLRSVCTVANSGEQVTPELRRARGVGLACGPVATGLRDGAPAARLADEFEQPFSPRLRIHRQQEALAPMPDGAAVGRQVADDRRGADLGAVDQLDA